MNILHNLTIATEAIRQNKIRTGLTSLGIIFGVAAVIAMLGIGKGMELELLEQMKALGSNNIIIKALIEQEEGKVEKEDDKKKQKRWSPGLTVSDMQSIPRVIPNVDFASPEIVVECLAVREGFKRSTKLVGVDSAYFTTTDYPLAEGNYFNGHHILNGMPVCVIGYAIKAKFFATTEALGKQIKCGDLWLTVVGVLREKNLSEKTLKHLGIRDYNLDIYSPYTTVMRRYKNRATITKQMLNKEAAENNNDDEEKNLTEEEKNYHQLDKIIVRVSNSVYSSAVADVLSRMLERRHNHIVDYEVTVPEQLLRQEQRTKDMFRLVLVAIACISLIVGGIGIMNIMLASVLERTREIGTRRAIGATQRDITVQFLGEAVALSVGGGIAGIVVGLSLSIIIEKLADITTIVTPFSVILSFMVAVTIGLLSGYLPARRAAKMDPITALRYE